MAAAFSDVAEIRVDPARARVYEHGWQSWSPTTSYALGQRPARPRDRRGQVMGWWPGREAPADSFQGEGLIPICLVPHGQLVLVAFVGSASVWGRSETIEGKLGIDHGLSVLE